MRPRKALRPTSLQEIAADPIKTLRAEENRRLAYIWKRIWDEKDLPPFAFDEAQFTAIWSSIPDDAKKAFVKQRVQDDLELTLTNREFETVWKIAIQSPATNIDSETRELNVAGKTLPELAETMCAAYVAIRHTLKEMIEKDIKCTLVTRKWILLINKRSRPGVKPNRQLRFLAERLSSTWWWFTETEARRSLNNNQFGGMLLSILKALSQSEIDFGLGANLRLDSSRVSVANKMLHAIDRTKAGGFF